MLRTCVTGAAGFLGSHLCKRLLAQGNTVIGIDNLSGGCLENFGKWSETNKFVFHRKDCGSIPEMEDIFKKYHKCIDVVYHLAADATEGRSQFTPLSAAYNNYWANQVVLTNSIKAGVKRYICCSCHDAETKLVTKRGIVSYSDIKDDDIVFTLNKDGFLEEKKLNKIFTYDYDGEMVRFSGKTLDQMVTPEHRVLYVSSFNKTPSIKMEKAKEFITRSQSAFPTSKGILNTGLDKPVFTFSSSQRHWNVKKEPISILTEDLFYLVGLFIADGVATEKKSVKKSKTSLTAAEYVSGERDSLGHFQNVPTFGGDFTECTTYTIRYCVPKKDKARKRLEETLTRSGIGFSSRMNGSDPDGIVYITSKNLFDICKDCGGKSYEKHVPSWMLSYAPKYLQCLIDGIMDGDGDKKRVLLTTTSKNLVDNMVELRLKTGGHFSYSKSAPKTTILKDGRHIYGRRDVYHVYLHTKKNNFLTVLPRNMSKVKYTGKVWCLSVPNENFLVERNGRFCFSGNSMSVYGDQKPPFPETYDRKPVDVYGMSKTAMEKTTEILCGVHDVEYVIMRPHNVYGPNQSLSDPYRNVAAIWMNCLMRRKPFYIYGDGCQVRAFSYVDDVVNAMVNCSTYPVNGEIFNLGAEKAVTLNYLAEIILSEFTPFSNELKPIYIADRPREVKYAYSTVEKSVKMLDFKETVTLKEGIRRMAEWAKGVGPKEPKYLGALEIDSPKAPATWREKLI